MILQAARRRATLFLAAVTLILMFRGSTFSSGQALANAITRELNQAVERKVRQAASSLGLRVRRTLKGLEGYGNAAKMNRFQNRFGR